MDHKSSRWQEQGTKYWRHEHFAPNPYHREISEQCMGRYLGLLLKLWQLRGKLGGCLYWSHALGMDQVIKIQQ